MVELMKLAKVMGGTVGAVAKALVAEAFLGRESRRDRKRRNYRVGVLSRVCVEEKGKGRGGVMSRRDCVSSHGWKRRRSRGGVRISYRNRRWRIVWNRKSNSWDRGRTGSL